MCVVSMVGDSFGNRWGDQYPQPVSPGAAGIGGSSSIFVWPPPGPTKEEFDALKKEVLLMKELLQKAKLYDEKNNQPDCELEEKISMLRKVAEAVGVSLDDIFVRKAQDKQSCTEGK